MAPKPYTSKDLAKDIVKKRVQGPVGRKYAAPGRDDQAVGGQGATDFSRGYVRGSKDRIGTTTGRKGKSMPLTGWPGLDYNVTNGPGQVRRYKRPV